MNPLRFPVSSVGEEGLEVDVTAPVAMVQPPGIPGIPLERVRVQGMLMPVDDTDMLFQGRLTSELVQACDRCLMVSHSVVAVEAAWLYHESPVQGGDAGELDEDDDDDVEVFAIHNGEVDLSSQMWEELVLAVPHKVLCRPDCKGLCPRCGANLNEKSCCCKQTEETPDPPENGLGALAQMFPEWVRKKPEE